jgi:hypothetical protein
MTFAPRFSPDGARVIMSLQQEGNANVFAMDLRTKKTTRLTNDAAIDTSPCYAPDGGQIAFESDRGGSQQIYIMGADGSNPRRITFGDGTYSTPVWSARRPHRFHPAECRPVRYRRDQVGRFRHAHPHRRLPQRGPDLGAERQGDHVLPRRGGSRRRSSIVYDRHHRLQ